MSKGAIKVKIRRLPHGEDLPMPAYQSTGAAGLDLLAAVPANEERTLPAGAYAVIPTGLSLELPRGTEAQVRPRSGLAAKSGVTVLNSPGTIDADYRGEVGVILINHGKEPFVIRRGDRNAQLVIGMVAQARIVEAKTLSATKRGAGGFGSTGIAAVEKRSSSGGQKKTIAAKRKSAKTPAQASRPAKWR